MAGLSEERFVDGYYYFNGTQWIKSRDLTEDDIRENKYNGWADDWGNNITRSDTAADAAVSSSQSAVDAILGRQGDVDAAVASMRGAADNMLPIAGDLRNQGNAMFESGTKVTEQALETLGTGTGFLRMDSSASPLVAEALKLYGEFDPNRYVATAAQDVQSSFDNARGQQQRNLSRMGVSPGSGAALANERDLSRAQAMAAAAAMTRARERGKTDQAAQFQRLISNNANTFLQTGGQLASIGSSMRSAGAGALGNAANVLGNAGNLYGNAGSLSLNFGKDLAGAYNALAGTQMNKADLAQKTASQVLQWAGKSGGGGGGGVRTSGQMPDDNWGNWKNTGHSETWNYNHNPEYWALANNGQASNPNPAVPA